MVTAKNELTRRSKESIQAAKRCSIRPRTTLFGGNAVNPDNLVPLALAHLRSAAFGIAARFGNFSSFEKAIVAEEPRRAASMESNPPRFLQRFTMHPLEQRIASKCLQKRLDGLSSGFRTPIFVGR